MAGYVWSPPTHPDPPEDQPLGVGGEESLPVVPGFPPVWVEVVFTRTGKQRLKAFVERADADLVYVQLVHMGFAHHVCLPRDRVTKRTPSPSKR